MKREDLHNLLSPAVEALGLECLGIDFVPQHGSSLLRLFIDAPGRAVTLDDCETVSREVAALLDVNDPIAGRYTLEVSSPGLDRPLFTAAQFARHVGATVKLQTHVPIDGRRRFQGPIRAVEGDRIVIEQDGSEVALRHADVLKANLVPDLAAIERDFRGPTKDLSDKPQRGSGRRRAAREQSS